LDDPTSMRRYVKAFALLAVAAAVAANASPCAAETGLKACESIDRQDARIDCYTRIIEDPNGTPASRAKAYSQRSNSLSMKGEYDRAIDDANRALAIDPQDHDGYFARAYAHHEKGEIDLATADYDRAIAIKPRDANALINRALLRDRNGDHDGAIREYAAIIDMHAAEPLLSKTGVITVYNDRGVARLNGGDFDNAIADFNKAIEVDPKFATGYFNRGRAYFAKGNNDGAIADCSKALEIRPAYALAHLNRARAYRNKDNFSEAIEDFEKAIDLDRSNKDAGGELAMTFWDAAKEAMSRWWKNLVGG
jgi:tetratricopeptide (TPR) repeat protein